MYRNIKELIEQARDKSEPVWKIILDKEIKLTECSKEQIYEKLNMRYDVMYKSTHKALNEPQDITGDLISGNAKRQYDYSEQQDTLGGFLINHIMALALSASEVNASMGRICAAPTAGSCGILPAVLIGVSIMQLYPVPRAGARQNVVLQQLWLLQRLYKCLMVHQI